METGMIMEILRCSVHDGPGIRTTVFLKGCTLHCLWCHNPEGMGRNPQLRYDDKKCTKCGKCEKVCPKGVHKIDGAGRHGVFFSRCTSCGECAPACPGNALSVVGKEMTTGDVLSLVKKDMAFYQKTGGGITLSGGESLMQPEFVLELLEGCKKLGIHTAIETAGHVTWEALEATVGLTDLYLYDYKASTEEMQRTYTGGSRKLIMDHLERLDAALMEKGTGEIWLRCPVIPGVNDSKEHLKSIQGIRNRYPSVKKTELMPYHELGKHKWAQVGLTYNPDMAGKKAPSRQEVIYWESLIL